MKNVKTVFMGIMLAFIFIANANAAPFQNGSFEGGVLSNPSFTTLSTGATAIAGWTIPSGSIDYIGEYWIASDGERSIDLNGNGPGAISQTFDTRPGAAYQVTFDIAGNPDGAPVMKALVVSDGIILFSASFDITGQNSKDMGWEERSFNFVASTSATTLQFSSSIDGPYGPALDNVRVQELGLPAIDTRQPAGAVHAHDNLIWPPNKKMVPVIISGYVVDELSASQEDGGIGVAEAYLIIDGEKIDLNEVDPINGRFKLVKEFQARKGATYLIELFATDANGNSGLVDSTYVRVPHNMSRKYLPAYEGEGKTPPGQAKSKKNKK
jgi:choice-of-anchor C domain-containing protein